MCNKQKVHPPCVKSKGHLVVKAWIRSACEKIHGCCGRVRHISRFHLDLCRSGLCKRSPEGDAEPVNFLRGCHEAAGLELGADLPRHFDGVKTFHTPKLSASQYFGSSFVQRITPQDE